jgi:hypothetical protein
MQGTDRGFDVAGTSCDFFPISIFYIVMQAVSSYGISGILVGYKAARLLAQRILASLLGRNRSDYH